MPKIADILGTIGPCSAGMIHLQCADQVALDDLQRRLDQLVKEGQLRTIQLDQTIRGRQRTVTLYALVAERQPVGCDDD